MSALGDVADRWERFWFEPQATSTLALVRIAFGVVAFAWTLALAPVLGELLGPEGVLPSQPGPGDPFWQSGSWGVFGLLEGEGALWTGWAVLLAATICVTLGLATRPAAIVVFVGMLSIARRDPLILNSGDSLLRATALFLALSPAGASVSLDRLLHRREEFWRFPARAPWGLRLIQVLTSIVYLTGAWTKLNGASWTEGTAVAYAMTAEDLQRFPLPEWLVDSPLIVNLMSWGTIAVELALATLIWNRRARPYVIAAGIALHLGITITLRVGFFSWAVFVLYVAFIPPETAERWIGRVRERVAGLAVLAGAEARADH